MEVLTYNPLVWIVIAINLLPLVGLLGAFVYTIYWACFEKKDLKAKQLQDPYWSVCDQSKQGGLSKPVIFMQKAEALLAKMKNGVEGGVTPQRIDFGGSLEVGQEYRQSRPQPAFVRPHGALVNPLAVPLMR